MIQVNMNDTLVNPHNKLFLKTWKNIDVGKDYQNNYLPELLLKRISLDSGRITGKMGLLISLDWFIKSHIEFHHFFFLISFFNMIMSSCREKLSSKPT